MGWTVAIGVDTHKDVHVAVAFDALGVQLGSREIAATVKHAEFLGASEARFGDGSRRRLKLEEPARLVKSMCARVLVRSAVRAAVLSCL